MKAGKLGKLNSDFGRIDDFELTVDLKGDDQFNHLKQCVQVRETVSLPNGKEVQLGRAAIEDITESPTTQISDGEIRRYERQEKTTLYTEFLLFPGRFVVAGSGSGSFVFDLLGTRTDSVIEPVDIDLEGYLEEHSEGTTWKVGFYSNIGNAENGVVHGEDVVRDDEVGHVLESSKKNQVGLEHNRDGVLVKTFVTASGYVEVYQPSNYDAGEYAQYVSEEIMPHAIEK